MLDVEPGALTPLAMLNDPKNMVTAVIDASLMGAEQLNFHPLTNTQSTGIHPHDLLSFIASCGREAVISDLAYGDA